MTLEDLDFPPVLRVLRKLSLSVMIASVVSVFGEDASEPTGADVAPTDISLKVLCAVVGFPQIHTVVAPPLSTLADAEPAIKAQCGVGERETEFAEVDESGATVRVDPTRLVREFAGTGSMLMLRPFGAADLPPAPTSLRHSIVRAEVPLPTRDEIAVKFTVAGSGEAPFTKVFRKEETMKVAREAVAQDLGLDDKEITLLFAGKPFADEFVLGRLRIGSQAVTVYVKQKAEVLLLSYCSNEGSDAGE
jgi:hypothetical protein